MKWRVMVELGGAEGALELREVSVGETGVRQRVARVEVDRTDLGGPCDASALDRRKADRARRIVTGNGGEYFYTPDHYVTFKLVTVNA